MAGFPKDAGNIQNRAGALSVAARDLFASIDQFVANVLSMSDAEMEEAGVPAGDVPIIRAGITDLYDLGQIARGFKTQAAPNDFFYNARDLQGTN
jgi:hypothetical protein